MLPYKKFRTGLTYRQVYQMLWSASDDPRDWRYKGRHQVLGMWHQIKMELYSRYVDACSPQAAPRPKRIAKAG